MKNILLFGDGVEILAETFTKQGCVIVQESPDVVVSYGGDGTLLKADHLYPGIPKLYIKNTRIGKLAHNLSNEEVLEKFCRGEYTIEESFKLEALVRGEKVVAVNDIVIHNKDPRYAVRYHVEINKSDYIRDVVGDGVIVATPLGSRGYYRSITDSYFELGIGIAFNNSTEQADHIVLKPDVIIHVEIARGPASCYGDNQEKEIVLTAGDVVEIRRSEEVIRMIRV
jgi:NAD+ kinase